MSGPVRTPFGWHLIVVDERRSQDVTHGAQARGRAQCDPAAQVGRAVPGIRAAGSRQGLRRIQDGRAVTADAARAPGYGRREWTSPRSGHRPRARFGRAHFTAGPSRLPRVALGARCPSGCPAGGRRRANGRHAAPRPRGTDDHRLGRHARVRGHRGYAPRAHGLGARSDRHPRRRRARGWRAARRALRHCAGGRCRRQARLSRLGARGIRVRG